MDTITLTLPESDFHVPISRDMITTYLNDTLLGSTLELDPTVENIDITSPDVTPSVLTFLSHLNVTDREFPIGLIPPQNELQRAYRYLGGHVLELFSSPQYQAIQHFGNNYLNPTYFPNLTSYEQYVNNAILSQWPALLRWVGSLFPPETTRDIDTNRLFMTQYSPEQYVLLIKYVLDRGVIPTYPIVVRAIYTGNMELIRRVLTTPGVDLSETYYYVLGLALEENNPDIIALVLARPEIKNFNMNDFAKHLDNDSRDVSEESWHQLFHEVGVTSAPTDELLRIAMEYELTNLIYVLLMDPRTNIGYNHDALVAFAAAHGTPRMKRLIVTHPKFNWATGDQ